MKKNVLNFKNWNKLNESMEDIDPSLNGISIVITDLEKGEIIYGSNFSTPSSVVSFLDKLNDNSLYSGYIVYSSASADNISSHCELTIKEGIVDYSGCDVDPIAQSGEGGKTQYTGEELKEAIYYSLNIYDHM